MKLPSLAAECRRFLWFVRYQFVQKSSRSRIVMETVEGYQLLVLPGVFNPIHFFTSAFMARHLPPNIPRGAEVLDLGCGTGLLGIVAADRARSVVATDLNPDAVRCAKINILLNSVDCKVSVLEGDLFQPVGMERFDLVLFNPPYLTGVARERFELGFRGGDIPDRFCAALPGHLRQDGRALVVLSSRGRLAEFLQGFEKNGLEHALLAREDLVGEVLSLYGVQARQ